MPSVITIGSPIYIQNLPEYNNSNMFNNLLIYAMKYINLKTNNVNVGIIFVMQMKVLSGYSVKINP